MPIRLQLLLFGVIGNVLVAAGQMVTEEHAEAIGSSGVDQALIRSALLCEAKKGICGNCYGRDLARGTDVNIGEAVGVIAAQSIGEPGTQLTMRTFHVGGAAQRGAEQSNIEAAIGGSIKLEDANLVKDKVRHPNAANSHNRTDWAVVDGPHAVFTMFLPDSHCLVIESINVQTTTGAYRSWIRT